MHVMHVMQDARCNMQMKHRGNFGFGLLQRLHFAFWILNYRRPPNTRQLLTSRMRTRLQTELRELSRPGWQRDPGPFRTRCLQGREDRRGSRLRHPQGCAGTPMPATNMSEGQAKKVVAYLRATAATKTTATAVGDAARGKAVFDGKGGAAKCHRAASLAHRGRPDAHRGSCAARPISNARSSIRRRKCCRRDASIASSPGTAARSPDAC